MINYLKSLFYFLPKYKITNLLISYEFDKEYESFKQEQKDIKLSQNIKQILSNFDNQRLKKKWLNQLDISHEHILFELIALKYWKSTEVVFKNIKSKDLNISNKSGESLFFVLSQANLLYPDFSAEFIMNFLLKTPSLKLSPRQYLEFYKSAMQANNHLIMDIILKEKYAQLDTFTQNLMRQAIFEKITNKFSEEVVLTWMKYFWTETNSEGNNIVQFLFSYMESSPWYYHECIKHMNIILSHLEKQNDGDIIAFFEQKNANQQNILEMSLHLNNKHQNFSLHHEKLTIIFEKALFGYKMQNQKSEKIVKRIKI